jgi:hypothetical protein
MKFSMGEDGKPILTLKLQFHKMKMLGFIKEYNDLKESVGLDEFLSSRSQIAVDIDKVLQYLEKGELVLGWMGYFKDVKTQKPIAPDSYFTDGVWVWPAYFPYYLKMFPSTNIDESFVEYLVAKNYKFENDFEDRIGALENELAKRFKESKL